MTTIKTIPAACTTVGRPVAISINAHGRLEIDGYDTWTRPIVKTQAMHLFPPRPEMPADVAGWMWGGERFGLPKHSKIGFSEDEIAAAYAAAKDVLDAYQSAVSDSLAKHRERKRLEREWDNVNNEGGDGYNPYRDADLSGTDFDPRERHFPDGA